MTHHSCPPQLKLSTILLGLAIFLCGCSSSSVVGLTGMPDAKYGYREMNEELKGHDVKIELTDGRNISAKEVNISDDSVSWVDQRSDERSQSSIRAITRIVTKSHGMGALDGLGLGLLGGGGIGALVGQLTWGNSGDWGSGSGAAIGLILGGGTGLVVGLTAGLMVGHSHNYQFPMTEQSDSLQNGK